MSMSLQPHPRGRASANARGSALAAIGRSVDRSAGKSETGAKTAGSKNPKISRWTGLVKAGNRPDNVVAFEESVIGFFIEAADLVGAPKSVAAIYGICFASPEPLSFSEINARLEISSGSISQGLRVLHEVGALKITSGVDLTRTAETVSSPPNLGPKDPQNGKWAARYKPQLELRKLLQHWIDKRLQEQIVAGRRRLKLIIARVPRQSPEYTILSQRLGALDAWHSKAEAVVPLLNGLLRDA
jgi:HTH-type transcriptional regulator, glycine betaine synthesis regulator